MGTTFQPLERLDSGGDISIALCAYLASQLVFTDSGGGLVRYQSAYLSKPKSTENWMSKGVLGEQLWIQHWHWDFPMMLGIFAVP